MTYTRPVYAAALAVCLAIVLGVFAYEPPIDMISPQDARADDVAQSAVGVVEYTPPPDLTVCFCGSYFLRGEKGEPSFYLVSEAVDLDEFVGRKVTASGKPFLTPCQGTLLQSCSFLNVTSIDALVATPAEASTWGRIKQAWR